MRLDAEANLQAEFYHAARLIGLPVALEVETPAGRLDVAILNAARTALVAIVEVKRDPISFAGGQSAQITRYKQIGVPVYGLSAANNPHALAATIKARHGPETGISIDAIAKLTHLKRERLLSRFQRRLQRYTEAGFNLK